MPKYTHDEIISRTELSRKMYYQIEGYVNDFLDYVPFDYNHLEVYSLKLVTILLETGPELINSFDLAICETGTITEHLDKSISIDRERLREKEKKLKGRKKSLTFSDYYRFLDKHGIRTLSSASILLRGFNAYTMPFENVNPKWWENHNLLKHDKYSNLKVATLRTTLKASSALFWLVNHNSRTFCFYEEPLPSKLFLPTEPYELNSSLKKL